MSRPGAPSAAAGIPGGLVDAWPDGVTPAALADLGGASRGEVALFVHRVGRPREGARRSPVRASVTAADAARLMTRDSVRSVVVVAARWVADRHRHRPRSPDKVVAAGPGAGHAGGRRSCRAPLVTIGRDAGRLRRAAGDDPPQHPPPGRASRRGACAGVVSSDDLHVAPGRATRWRSPATSSAGLARRARRAAPRVCRRWYVARRSGARAFDHRPDRGRAERPPGPARSWPWWRSTLERQRGRAGPRSPIRGSPRAARGDASRRSRPTRTTGSSTGPAPGTGRRRGLLRAARRAGRRRSGGPGLPALRRAASWPRTPAGVSPPPRGAAYFESWMDDAAARAGPRRVHVLRPAAGGGAAAGGPGARGEWVCEHAPAAPLFLGTGARGRGPSARRSGCSAASRVERSGRPRQGTLDLKARGVFPMTQAMRVLRPRARGRRDQHRRTADAGGGPGRSRTPARCATCARPTRCISQSAARPAAPVPGRAGAPDNFVKPARAGQGGPAPAEGGVPEPRVVPAERSRSGSRRR